MRYLLTATQSPKPTLLYLASRVVREEGMGALYKGLHVQLVRNAVTMPLLLLFSHVHSTYDAYYASTKAGEGQEGKASRAG